MPRSTCSCRSGSAPSTISTLHSSRRHRESPRMMGAPGGVFGLRKNGEEFPADAAISNLEVGGSRVLTAVVRDVTEQKRTENEQRFLAEVGPVLATTLDYEETVSRIAEMATQGLADFCVVDLVDEKGEVRRVKVVSRDPAKVWMCEALQRIPFDQGRPPLVRSTLGSRQPFLLPRLTTEDVERLAATDAHRQILIAAQLQSLMVIPLIAAGRRLGAISFLSATPSHLYGPDDLRMARELAQRAALAVDSARLYRAAQRAIQVRDEVLGIVAHDLRNPLSLILMEARLLESGWKGRERRKRTPAEVIEGAATRMNRLIQDLLDVTSIEAGQLTIETCPSGWRATRLRCGRRPSCAGVVRVDRASARHGAGGSRDLGGSRTTPPGVRQPHWQCGQVHRAGRVHHGRSGPSRHRRVILGRRHWLRDRRSRTSHTSSIGSGRRAAQNAPAPDWDSPSSRASSRPTAVESGSRARQGEGARSSSRFRQRRPTQVAAAS